MQSIISQCYTTLVGQKYMTLYTILSLIKYDTYSTKYIYTCCFRTAKCIQRVT